MGRPSYIYAIQSCVFSRSMTGTRLFSAVLEQAQQDVLPAATKDSHGSLQQARLYWLQSKALRTTAIKLK